MSDDPVDLSLLDPARAGAAWEARVARVSALAQARRRRGVGEQMLAWARPSLALAASVALVTWAAVWAAGRATPAPRADAALELSRWASSDELPATPELLRVLGGGDARR